MSLARFALRTCAVRALTGATLVGDNVRDSDFGAIDVAADGSIRSDQDRPFVLVYTDDSTAEDTATRDLRQNGHLDLVVESGVANPLVETDETTGESRIVGINLPDTDAARELTLDLIDRQVTVALTGPDTWAELWQRLHNRVLRIDRRRAASTEGGVRLAARQLRIRLDVLADPAWGQPLVAGNPWADFVAALIATDPALGAVAATFLGPQGPAVTTETIRRAMGHTGREARALGYGPFHPGGVTWLVEEPIVTGGPGA